MSACTRTSATGSLWESVPEGSARFYNVLGVHTETFGNCYSIFQTFLVRDRSTRRWPSPQTRCGRSRAGCAAPLQTVQTCCQHYQIVAIANVTGCQHYHIQYNCTTKNLQTQYVEFVTAIFMSCKYRAHFSSLWGAHPCHQWPS